ncbi:uncharacterized protein TwdlC [Eurosta solidaginis]|uniref:uncharacterized protein TwdlC n=1 Tax=Eurosta solidaginis TaxID=178769 RepID=UPI003530C524
MRAFVLVSCLIVNALARPEAGYTYNGLQKNIASQSHIHQQQLPTAHVFANFAAPPSNIYGAPHSSEITLNSIEHGISATASSKDVSHYEHEQHHQPQPLSLDQQDSYNAAYHDSGISHESGYPYAPQQTTVHKHVYVHVPPKEFEQDDVIETRVHHAPAAKQKHYKIVFIKAPASPAIRPPIVPPLPQNEEKTLIYVLHKKPEDIKDIVIPTAAPTKPSKPEVYFIKYKTKKEEAPVYGPPPKQIGHINSADLDPRHNDGPASAYSSSVADEYTTDLTAPLTTNQPAVEHEQQQQQQHQQQQFLNNLPADAFELHTSMPFDDSSQPQSNVRVPSKQYLAPETMSPIVVEEPSSQLPSSNYGPPEFYHKKK